ncbi:hypothetical protein CTAYLR_006375 [Chrysophaeum taylorii]|uniref:Uncharacterized protein n=1 Tax=Chrysophaeum taylorii TaxID=2483200 RepID=A0AAD7U6V0_9STRA|nr:hypothetical protein CTAYLR_006375 [Chrysophaeum taylorii]
MEHPLAGVVSSSSSTSASGGGAREPSSFPAPPPAGAATPPQPTLRVMRLYKPKLWIDPCGGIPGEMRMTESMILPDSFGNIYRGEKFSAYVSIINSEAVRGGVTLKDVVVSAKLQSPGSKRAVELEDVSAARRAAMDELGMRAPERWIEREAAKRPSRRKQNPASRLHPGENVDMIVEHSLIEVGTHTLRISVSYTESVEPKSVRKFYRFSVADPFSIEARALPLPAGRSENVGLVEARITNAMHERCILDVVTLQPPPGFSVKEIKATPELPQQPKRQLGPVLNPAVGEDEINMDTFLASEPPFTVDEIESLIAWDPVAEYDAMCHLEPRETVSKVFAMARASSPASFSLLEDRASSEEEVDRGDELLPQTAGVLRVAWSASMGEKGEISTPPVEWHPTPAMDDYDTEPSHASPLDRDRVVFARLDPLPPDHAVVGDVLKLECLVSNKSDRAMSLQLQWRLDRMPRGLKPQGIAFVNLGLVEPAATKSAPLEFRALEPGLHPFTGAVVVDLESAREFSIPSLASVLVFHRRVPNFGEVPPPPPPLRDDPNLDRLAAENIMAMLLRSPSAQFDDIKDPDARAAAEAATSAFFQPPPYAPPPGVSMPDAEAAALLAAAAAAAGGGASPAAAESPTPSVPPRGDDDPASAPAPAKRRSIPADDDPLGGFIV